MAKTNRDVAIDQMIATVEEAMSHAIDWWGSLPKPMNEAIDKFRIQLGAAIDSVEFVKKPSTGQYRKRHGRLLNSDDDWLQARITGLQHPQRNVTLNDNILCVGLN